MIRAVPDVIIVNTLPPPLPTLRNRYYLLRHGQSTANVQHIISSARDLGDRDTPDLTALGVQQGRAAARPLLDLLQQYSRPGDHIALVASPVARARQTAAACWQSLRNDWWGRTMALGLNVLPLQLHDGLVERYFGRLDGEAIYTYAYVWSLDWHNTTHTAFDVESVAAVCHRMRAAILDLEELYGDEHHSRYEPQHTTHIVLTSHADVLQITQLYAAQHSNVGSFSNYRFANGEVRPMLLNTTLHLPDASPLSAPQRITISNATTVFGQ